MLKLRRIAWILCLLLLPVAGLGETLYTASCFAGGDVSAISYAELLREFERETGVEVVDSSSTSDERWKNGVLNDFAAGNEPDILFFFAANADSSIILNRVVSLEEINEAYPEVNFPISPALVETDGRCYAVPVRGYWEGLFVNLELFEEVGAPLPTTWEAFEEDIRLFGEAGIVPIALSLSDIPHYIAEFSILSCSEPEAYAARPQSLEEVPDSWFEGMRLIHTLYEMGAFAEDVLYTTETDSSRLFREGKAAMQLDGSWFANTLDADQMSHIVVLPMPSYVTGEASSYTIGGVSMGFYLTRKCWNTPARRDAAVALLSKLTSDEARMRLSGQTWSGKLQESIGALSDPSVLLLKPIQDDMNSEAREFWLLKCIPAVAEGSMSAEECWEQVFDLSGH